MNPHDQELDHIFGSGQGATAEARALQSSRLYVRSLDQIAEDSTQATGRRLSAFEALDAFGLDVLREVASEGSALLSTGRTSAGRLIRDRRELLGLKPRHVANSANVTEEIINRVEDHRRVPIRQVERIARVLGLDERLLSFKSEPSSANQAIAIRLRTIGTDMPRMTSSAVKAIAESAWVAGTQLRLQKKIGLELSTHGIEKTSNYGALGYPPYRHGSFLAGDARDRLTLGTDVLPCSLREIAEDKIGIPVIQAEIGDGIAGLTIEVGQDRAIVLNLDGANRNVFVRRATIAHELGHLLYDPEDKLNTLVVDEYERLDRQPPELNDPVEQRANAFGVEFIAPQDAVVDYYKSFEAGDAVWEVMDRFGVSYSIARYQIWNGLERAIPLESLRSTPDRRPSESWEGRESFTIDYHPIRGIRLSRAGRFSAIVLRAAEEQIISWDTAAEYLETSKDELFDAAHAIKALFPTVFA